MNLQYRIDLLQRLGDYILSNDPKWEEAKDKASRENAWFIPEFIGHASGQIATSFLQKPLLEDWVMRYSFPELQPTPRKIGIVMAGNIPLVGFHDMLSVFISGHIAIIKASSKDEVLIKHLVAKLVEWEPAAGEFLVFSTMLKACDAYIATGSNNSAGHFEYYFGKYPNIIRRNRTSVAILDGTESSEELALLADDVYMYFGLGCRNVTMIYVPEEYDFVPLLTSFRKYNYLANHDKYRNNYDYHLAIQIMNNRFYMTNDSIVLVEDKSPFSPISQLHYSYYSDKQGVQTQLINNPSIQCLVAHGHTGFGKSQHPGIGDFADGIDTLAFLSSLK